MKMELEVTYHMLNYLFFMEMTYHVLSMAQIYKAKENFPPNQDVLWIHKML